MKEAHPERKAEVQVKNHVCGHVCNPNSEFMAVALSEPDSEPARGHFACEHPLLLWKTCVAAAAAKLLQSCPTLQPHRWLPRPWDSPGKNTGVG